MEWTNTVWAVILVWSAIAGVMYPRLGFFVLAVALLLAHFVPSTYTFLGTGAMVP